MMFRYLLTLQQIKNKKPETSNKPKFRHFDVLQAKSLCLAFSCVFHQVVNSIIFIVPDNRNSLFFYRTESFVIIFHLTMLARLVML